jgi:hypothetical protein
MVKRNGTTVKSWAGLTGEQNLSWDGMANRQALADGSYRIVAMTERQRDRVRDAQMVVLDTVAPQVSYKTTHRPDGKQEVKAQITEPCNNQCSGLDLAQIDFQLDSLEFNLLQKTVISATRKKALYQLDIGNNFIASDENSDLSFSTLQATDGQNKLTGHGRDLAGNAFTDSGFQIAYISCWLNNQWVDNWTPIQHWFIFTRTDMDTVCQECPKGQISEQVDDYTRKCKPLKCPLDKVIGENGHECVPAPPQPQRIFPNNGEEACPSSGGNYMVGAVFDVDAAGPDVTVLVIPKRKGEMISGQDIQAYPNSGNFDRKVSLLSNVGPHNAEITMADDKKRAKEAQKLYEKGRHQKNGQGFINQAWDLLHKIDTGVPSPVEVGTTPGAVRDNIIEYEKTSPVFAALLKSGVQDLGYSIPDNYGPDSAEDRGRIYIFALDTNKPNANLSAIGAGQMAQVLIKVKGETIKLNLTKQNTGNSKWRASCG